MARETARRDEVAQAATDYVLEHGLVGLSLRPLAAQLGTSDRMLLYHFDGKDDLVATVLRISNDRSVTAIRALPPAPDVRQAVLDLGPPSPGRSWTAASGCTSRRPRSGCWAASPTSRWSARPTRCGSRRWRTTSPRSGMPRRLAAPGGGAAGRRDDGLPARPAPRRRRPVRRRPTRWSTRPCRTSRTPSPPSPRRSESGQREGLLGGPGHQAVLDQPVQASLPLRRRRPRRVEPAAVHRPLAVAEHRQQPATALPVRPVVGLAPAWWSVVRRVAGGPPGAQRRRPGTRRTAGPAATHTTRPELHDAHRPGGRGRPVLGQQAGRPARARPGSPCGPDARRPRPSRASTRRTLVSSTTCRRRKANDATAAAV